MTNRTYVLAFALQCHGVKHCFVRWFIAAGNINVSNVVVKPNDCKQMQAQINQYNFRQSMEVQKAADAMCDLCRAVKNVEEEDCVKMQM